jgi:hypothetical protein
MNWYKKISAAVLEKPTYHDIGHSDYEGTYDETDQPNLIWIYYDGDILAKEENDMTPTHQDAFPFVNPEAVYAGRYDPKSEQLSIRKPAGFIQQSRDIPGRMLHLLDQKFNQPIIHVF